MPPSQWQPPAFADKISKDTLSLQYYTRNFCFLSAWDMERKNSFLNETQKCYRVSLVRWDPGFVLPKNFLLFPTNTTFKWTRLTEEFLAHSIRRHCSIPAESKTDQRPHSADSAPAAQSHLHHAGQCLRCLALFRASRPELTLLRKCGLVGLGVRVSTSLFSPSPTTWMCVGTLWPSSKCVFPPWLLPVLPLCSSRLPYKWLCRIGVQRGKGLSSFA